MEKLWLEIRVIGNVSLSRRYLSKDINNERELSVRLEKGMATHSIILDWRIQWTKEPSWLHVCGSQRVGQDWAINSFTFTSMR